MRSTRAGATIFVGYPSYTLAVGSRTFGATRAGATFFYGNYLSTTSPSTGSSSEDLSDEAPSLLDSSFEAS